MAGWHSENCKVQGRLSSTSKSDQKRAHKRFNKKTSKAGVQEEGLPDADTDNIQKVNHALHWAALLAQWRQRPAGPLRSEPRGPSAWARRATTPMAMHSSTRSVVKAVAL